MNPVGDTLDRLHRLRHPFDLSFHHAGRRLAVALRPAAREAGTGFASRLWSVALDGDTVPLTRGPGSDAVPRFSPCDDRLAFASDRVVTGRMDCYVLGSLGEAASVGTIDGSIEDLRWTSNGKALVALAADRGLDVAATDGAVRLWWGDDPDPAVHVPGAARRRLHRIATADGATREVGPREATVWAFELVDDARAIALVSEDFTERGWYRARLAVIDLRDRSSRVLHVPRWQLQSPTADPAGRRAAFVEGWASDRGLVAGVIHVVDLAGGVARPVAADALSDVTFVAWRDEASLWFAGWSAMGTSYGVVRLDGTVEWQEREAAVVGLNSFFAHIAPAPDRKAFAAIRETVGAPPEVVLRAAPGSPWTALTRFNAGVAIDRYPEVRPIAWRGADGLELHGLVLVPPDGARPAPMIVDVHGGPTWSFKHAFDPGNALPFVAAGYVVFLPNYRGSVGWGQDFTRRNVGDPCGAEFDDILRGVARCVEDGLADPDRIGITGVSYGGYMTAWAAATSQRFKAAVMISGISNLLSCQFTCNHDFCEFIVGGPIGDAAARDRFVERSPLVHVDASATPTLILHGRDDHCTPLGQAEEFYGALTACGAEAEMVVYPREGHGFQEKNHREDAWRRTIGWFDRYLKGNR